jgi:hypothetical protein
MRVCTCVRASPVCLRGCRMPVEPSRVLLSTCPRVYVFVSLWCRSQGKGFQGGMKRWGFGGLNASHGVSVSHRSIGATGGRQVRRCRCRSGAPACHWCCLWPLSLSPFLSCFSHTLSLFSLSQSLPPSLTFSPSQHHTVTAVDIACACFAQHDWLPSRHVCLQDPGRVFKGKKMPGHMGLKTVTVEGLQVRCWRLCMASPQPIVSI